jgi:hypothetical protein
MQHWTQNEGKQTKNKNKNKAKSQKSKKMSNNELAKQIGVNSCDSER